MLKRKSTWVLGVVILLVVGGTTASHFHQKAVAEDIEYKRQHATFIVFAWKHIQSGDLKTAESYFLTAINMDPDEAMGPVGLHAIERLLEPGDQKERITRLEDDYGVFLKTLLNYARGAAGEANYPQVYRYTEMFLQLPKPVENPVALQEATALRDLARAKLRLGSL